MPLRSLPITRYPLLKQYGGVTIMTLVLLIVFVIITSASISYISRQAHETANKSQEEQAFGLGDAGIPYAQWLLSDKGGRKTPQELAQAFQDATPNNSLYAAFTDREVCNDGVCGANSTVLGTFTLAFGYDGGTGEVEVLSVGEDVNKPGECQRVRAFLIPFDDQGYQVIRWDHEPSRDCAITSNQFNFTAAECNNNQDDDNDGVTDHSGGDFSCDSEGDDNETLQQSQCQNGIDDDGDGTADAQGGGGLPADLGCGGNKQQNSEKSSAYLCDNGDDDEGDGRTDFRTAANTNGTEDPDCSGPTDQTEQPAPACANGIDDDLDGTADAAGAGGLPADVGCTNNPQGASELSGTVCNNGIDDDGQTGTDYRTPNNGGDLDCASPAGTTEAPLAACSNGIDDDHDGRTDHSSINGSTPDAGCSSATDNNERGAATQCDNGINDDTDTGIDYVQPGFTGGDAQCSGPTDNTEDDAPSNDNYAHAINAAASGANPPTHTVNTTFATTEPSENLSPCGPSIGKTVWYKYVLGSAGNPEITVDTIGSSFNTVLAVYKDNGNGLFNEQLLGCDSNGTVSKVTFTPQIGNTYFFQVSGTGNQGGNATFRFKLTDCGYGYLTLPSSAVAGLLASGDCTSAQRPGSYVDYYRFVAPAPNTKVRIKVWAWTGEFAPYVYLQNVTESGSCVDSNSACIPHTWTSGSITLPAAGEYQIAATSTSPNQTGWYVIAIAQDSTGGGSSPSPSPSPSQAP